MQNDLAREDKALQETVTAMNEKEKALQKAFNDFRHGQPLRSGGSQLRNSQYGTGVVMSCPSATLS